MSDGKRMDFWTVVRTVLEKNPGMKAKHLLQKLERKTGLARSTIYSHLESLTIREEIFREKGMYYLPRQWTERSLIQSQNAYEHPKMEFEITQRIYDNEAHSYLQPSFRRPFPSVGFNMFNMNDYSVRVRIRVRMILGGKDLGLIPDPRGHYNGKAEMEFEPGRGFTNGNFTVPEHCAISDEELTLEVRMTVIDPIGKVHNLLPRSWTYVRKEVDWFYEPNLFPI